MTSLLRRIPFRTRVLASSGPRLRLVGTAPADDGQYGQEEREGSVRVERIRAEIHAGTYETQARLDAATDRLLARLRG